ncbi:MAG: hypothetical protein PVG06_09145 [Desulfobacterales bacterium]|jgi:hypothetical protein
MSLKWNRLVLAGVVMGVTISLTIAANAQPQAQNKTFVIIGTSRVPGDNIQVARDEAIAESLVTAVALMTEEILKVDSLVENFPQVNEIVYENTDAFVQDYKVLTETRSGKSYRVIVEATVAGDKIAKQLSRAGILRAKVTLPTILFLISEQTLGENSPRYWWGKEMGGFEATTETTMVNILRAHGFPVVDHGGIEIRKMAGWDSSDKPELTDEEALNLATLLQAEVVIVGASIASPTPSVMGDALKSFKGNLNVRALRTETGEALASISRTAVTANIDESAGGREALAMAGTLAGDQLAPQLTAAWRELVEKPSQLEVTVEGTGNLANFVKFRRVLASISGVGGIRVKEIKPNEATLIVEYKGKAEDLASALMLQDFKNFGINIYEITQQNLKIAIVSS